MKAYVMAPTITRMTRITRVAFLLPFLSMTKPMKKLPNTSPQPNNVIASMDE